MAVFKPKSVQVTEPAEDELTRLRNELAGEQDRLRKLWEAFKAQEDELQALRNQPTPVAQASAPSPDNRAVESLRREVDLLTADLRRAAEAQSRLEEENQALRDGSRGHADVAHQASRLETELAEERERLAKLYAVYEEVEGQRRDLAARLKEWHAWFHGAAPHIEELARSIHGAPHEH